ncbi:hypothetical protein J6N69_06525 [bacterium]|nr:hypothetical protein [bacterium]
MTCALIPPFMSNVFGKNKSNNKSQTNNSTPTFTGLTKVVGRAIDKKFIGKMSERFANTNFPQHIISMTDALATSAFIVQTSKSKKIDEDRKKALMYNAGISTGLCITGGYVINNLTKKSTDKFIKNFREANKNSPKLEKYIEGIKIAKPALILGGLYYIAIPLLSTFLADKFDNRA